MACENLKGLLEACSSSDFYTICKLAPSALFTGGLLIHLQCSLLNFTLILEEAGWKSRCANVCVPNANRDGKGLSTLFVLIRTKITISVIDYIWVKHTRTHTNIHTKKTLAVAGLSANMRPQLYSIM